MGGGSGAAGSHALLRTNGGAGSPDRMPAHLPGRLFVLEGDGIVRLFDGTFSEYREEAAAAATAAPAAQAARPPPPPPVAAPAPPAASPAPSPAKTTGKKLLKLNTKEKQEYASIESEIEKLQEKQARLEKDLEAAGAQSNFAKVETISKEIAAITATIEQKEERWLDLAERAHL